MPQMSICNSLHLAPTSLTWSALVAILSPAGLVGAWLAPLAVSRFGPWAFIMFFLTKAQSRFRQLCILEDTTRYGKYL